MFNIDNSYDRFKPHYKDVAIYSEKAAKYINISILDSIFISLCCSRGLRFTGRFEMNMIIGVLGCGNTNLFFNIFTSFMWLVGHDAVGVSLDTIKESTINNMSDRRG